MVMPSQTRGLFSVSLSSSMISNFQVLHSASRARICWGAASIVGREARWADVLLGTDGTPEQRAFSE